MIYCMFEQSGTFKNAFKKLGYDAIDLDILNDFNQTDTIIDLFAEINHAYNEESSIFDKITENDLIIAFFPCVRFESQILINFRGQNYGMKNWSIEKKILNCMRLQTELTEMYLLINKLFLICMKKKLKLIVENPYSEEHYLRRYWCYPPSIIDKDRRTGGDYYKKPTQYWFVNFEPKNNLVMGSYNNAIDCKDPIKKMKKEHAEAMGAKSVRVARSMIHPQYAENFIKKYILEN